MEVKQVVKQVLKQVANFRQSHKKLSRLLLRHRAAAEGAHASRAATPPCARRHLCVVCVCVCVSVCVCVCLCMCVCVRMHA